MTALRPEISDIEEIRFDGGNVLVNNAAATQRKPFLGSGRTVSLSRSCRPTASKPHAGGIDDARMKKILAQYPLRRVGRPDDVTPMILLLASPLSGWTTGQVVSLSGGYAMV